MITDFNALINKITEEIKSVTDFAVVGLSGGVDSLCVAALCTLALGKENVLAVHMPHNEIDVKDELKFNGNSKRIAAKLGINDLYIPIAQISETLNGVLASALKTPLGEVNKGNSRSRTRMCILYGVAHHLNSLLGKKARVMGTGNLSEDFIGYDTKGGDALADIFPIGELYKSEVYQLADHLVEMGLIDKDMIDRNPSAGLWDGQTDEQELGYTYNEMESAIRAMRKSDGSIKEMYRPELANAIDKFVYNRHLANKHKHEAPPVIKLRNQSFLK